MYRDVKDLPLQGTITYPFLEKRKSPSKVPNGRRYFSVPRRACALI